MKIIPLSEAAEAAVIPDIIWNGQFGDIEPAGLDALHNRGGFVSKDAIASAVIICLMTDIRVDETELRDGDVNRGWPGDAFDMQVNEVPLGSKLWLLRRRTVDEVEVPRLAEQYAREALDTLIIQGVCVRVEVEAKGFPKRNRLDLEVRLYGRDGSQVFFEKYGVLWEQVKGVSGNGTNNGSAAAEAVAIDIGGTASGNGVASASIELEQTIAGAAAGEGVATASIVIAQLVSGSAVAEGVASASISSGDSISGSAEGVGAASASIDLAQTVSGSASGEATASASIELNQSISGSAAGEGVASADIVVGDTLWKTTDWSNQVAGYDGFRQAAGDVAAWTDYFGNGNDAVQGTAGRQPRNGDDTLGGLNVLTFDGTNDNLVLPANVYKLSEGDFCIVGLIRSNGSAAQRLISCIDGASSRSYIQLQNGNLNFSSRSAYSTGIVASYSVGDWFIFTAFRSGTVESISVNGNTPTTSVLASSPSITEGSIGNYPSNNTSNLDGNIAQIIFANAGQSLSEIQKAEGRLAHKYGVLSILDAGHPYETNPPMV